MPIPSLLLLEEPLLVVLLLLRPELELEELSLELDDELREELELNPSLELELVELSDEPPNWSILLSNNGNWSVCVC